LWLNTISRKDAQKSQMGKELQVSSYKLKASKRISQAMRYTHKQYPFLRILCLFVAKHNQPQRCTKDANGKRAASFKLQAESLKTDFSGNEIYTQTVSFLRILCLFVAK